MVSAPLDAPEAETPVASPRDSAHCPQPAARYNEWVQRPLSQANPQSFPAASGFAARHRAVLRAGMAALLLLAAVFFLLRFLHLSADFPNYSPWTDWAKYTDEGWYGDAAIRHYLRGTWRLPGDFNPAAALPVWPLLEAVVFRFTGVGIVAARTLTVVVFGGILFDSFLLLRTPSGLLPQRTQLPYAGVFAATAVLLMAVSPYFYAFSRMAVLEPLLVLLMLIALLLSGRVAVEQARWQKVLLEIIVGFVFALMVGTKTTAVALLPAIAFMLGCACRWRLRAVARAVFCAGLTAAVLWTVYYVGLVHRRYSEDFRYLFSANRYTGITAENARKTVLSAFADLGWMGHGTVLFFLLALVLAVLVPPVRRRVVRDPLAGALALWTAGYFAFLIYHANLQPRYYLVVAVPVTLLAMRLANHVVAWQPRIAFAAVPALLVLVAFDARKTLHYVRHPEYTFQNAATEIEQVVESEPNHSHTVLSISGSDLSLMTGLPSICDDFGTMELEDRIAAYKPGWFVAWNYVEDDKMEALAKFYRLTRVKELPAMDDPDRNLLIVYRLDPKDGRKPRRAHARKVHGVLRPLNGPNPLS